MPGTLYIVATPIGNLEDITLRALRILGEVDFIAAEDTRHTMRLLSRYEIKTPLVSCHEHNERRKAEVILKRLMDGESCALVSDAGMPLISDPGGELVRLCRENGVEATVCPGATAGATAFALSGFSSGKYCFEGFLPSRAKDRRAALGGLADETRVIVAYEAPHRLLECLADIRDILGERRVCVARELTKKHEDVATGTASELMERYGSSEVRGEIVLVIEGADGEALKRGREMEWRDMELADHFRLYAERGFSESDAIKAVAKDRGLPKREIYRSIKIDRG